MNVIYKTCIYIYMFFFFKEKTQDRLFYDYKFISILFLRFWCEPKFIFILLLRFWCEWRNYSQLWFNWTEQYYI